MDHNGPLFLGDKMSFKVEIHQHVHFTGKTPFKQEAPDVLHIRPRSRLREAFLLMFTE